MAESGKIGVLVHNAGHMMFGPAEAFLPEQFAVQYDVNVLGHATRQPGRAAAHARGETGSASLDLEQQLRWRNAALSRALFRGQSGDGLAGRPLCARAVALGHRDDDRAGRVHLGHERHREQYTCAR